VARAPPRAGDEIDSNANFHHYPLCCNPQVVLLSPLKTQQRRNNLVSVSSTGALVAMSTDPQVSDTPERSCEQGTNRQHAHQHPRSIDDD
jgi:hypothetical protein